MNTTAPKITRRTVLLTIAVTPLFLNHHQAAVTTDLPPTPPTIKQAHRPFGRALQGGAIIRETPGTKATKVRALALNEVIHIVGETDSDDSPSSYNKLWYQTSDGFVHSSLV